MALYKELTELIHIPFLTNQYYFVHFHILLFHNYRNQILWMRHSAESGSRETNKYQDPRFITHFVWE